jgi:uncharacterized protein (DUF427 family)
MRAVWNDIVIAQSDATVVVEGNHYFPPDAVRWEALTPTDHTSVCPWKGTARYWTVDVDGVQSQNAAWAYDTPSPAAAQIAGHVAFWRGVQVGD